MFATGSVVKDNEVTSYCTCHMSQYSCTVHWHDPVCVHVFMCGQWLSLLEYNILEPVIHTHILYIHTYIHTYITTVQYITLLYSNHKLYLYSILNKTVCDCASVSMYGTAGHDPGGDTDRTVSILITKPHISVDTYYSISNNHLL